MALQMDGARVRRCSLAQLGHRGDGKFRMAATELSENTAERHGDCQQVPSETAGFQTVGYTDTLAIYRAMTRADML